MRTTILSIALTVLVGGADVLAQGSSSVSKNSGGGGGVIQAPVGHRQPRASDVPADTPKTNEEETQIQRDRELDKKLWICRGCGEPL